MIYFHTLIYFPNIDDSIQIILSPKTHQRFRLPLHEKFSLNNKLTTNFLVSLFVITISILLFCMTGLYMLCNIAMAVNRLLGLKTTLRRSIYAPYKQHKIQTLVSVVMNFFFPFLLFSLLFTV